MLNSVTIFETCQTERSQPEQTGKKLRFYFIFVRGAKNTYIKEEVGKIRKYYVDKKKSTLYKVGAPVSHQQQANKAKTTAMIFTLLEGILPFSLFAILIFLMTYLIFKLVCNKIPVNVS